MDIVGFVDRCTREKSWRHPTTKICVSALTAFRGQVEDYTVFTRPAMHEYLEGAKRLSMDNITLPDTWDPTVVLRALEGVPFEPLATADMKWVSGKLIVLLLLTTAARVSEVTALMTSRIDFSANDEQVIIYPDPNFRPKTIDEIYPRTREERRYNLSCPVRAVRIYLQHTRAVWKSEKLFVSEKEPWPGHHLREIGTLAGGHRF